MLFSKSIEGNCWLSD